MQDCSNSIAKSMQSAAKPSKFIHHYVGWPEMAYNMMTSSNGNIFRVTGLLCGEFTGPGEFPTQRPATRSFDVFFDLRLNKRLSKQPSGWWFETPSWSLWRQCNKRHKSRSTFDMTAHKSLHQPLLTICPLKNINVILFKIHNFQLKTRWPFCSDLNVLRMLLSFDNVAENTHKAVQPCFWWWFKRVLLMCLHCYRLHP